MDPGVVRHCPGELPGDSVPRAGPMVPPRRGRQIVGFFLIRAFSVDMPVRSVRAAVCLMADHPAEAPLRPERTPLFMIPTAPSLRALWRRVLAASAVLTLAVSLL